MLKQARPGALAGKPPAAPQKTGQDWFRTVLEQRLRKLHSTLAADDLQVITLGKKSQCLPAPSLALSSA